MTSNSGLLSISLAHHLNPLQTNQPSQIVFAVFFSSPRLWTVESIWLLTQKEVSVFIRVRDEGKSCEYSHNFYFSFSTHLGAIFMSCIRIFSPGKSKLCESRLESVPSLLEKPRINNRLLASTFPSSQWVDLSSPLRSYSALLSFLLSRPQGIALLAAP